MQDLTLDPRPNPRPLYLVCIGKNNLRRRLLSYLPDKSTLLLGLTESEELVDPLCVGFLRVQEILLGHAHFMDLFKESHSCRLSHAMAASAWLSSLRHSENERIGITGERRCGGGRRASMLACEFAR